MEPVTRQLGPLTRAVNSGSGNQALVRAFVYGAKITKQSQRRQTVIQKLTANNYWKVCFERVYSSVTTGEQR